MRIASSIASTRVVPRAKWVHPKDRLQQWNIIRGDKVAIISGRDKDTIGEVKSVDRKTNTIIVEGKKLAKKHVQVQPAAPDGIMRKEQPIHVSNVMLLHPHTQLPTKIERRQVEKELPNGESKMKWSRFVKGTDIEIPKPTSNYDDRSTDESFTTSSEEALRATFDGTRNDVPAGLLEELGKQFRRFRASPTE